MASWNNTVIIEAVKRPCIVDGNNALFHTWSDRCEIVPPSMLKGGHGGGELRYTVGIVEYEDGTVGTVLPYEIRFIDNIHKNFSFTERATDEQSIKKGD